jgi:hypothetical protein
MCRPFIWWKEEGGQELAAVVIHARAATWAALYPVRRHQTEPPPFSACP